jgi:uncharacterized integral membrane protein
MSTPSGPAAERVALATRRRRRRETLAAVIGALLAAFALLNLGDVKVDWIITSAETPLIVVIGLAVLLGGVLDRLLIRRKKRQQIAARSAAQPTDQEPTAGRV